MSSDTMLASRRKRILEVEWLRRRILDLRELLVERLQGREHLQKRLPWHRLDHQALTLFAHDRFPTRQLELANIDLTSKLLAAARRWDVQRFVYVSTAFSAGYRNDSISEVLHPDPQPADEPTEYTRTKRMAEWRVAESGLPFLIVRPSIVIGDSRSGDYSGRNYGLYQMWRAWEALLAKDYSPVLYTVAPRVRLNFVHQDAFVAGFMGALRGLPPDSIVHLVSRHATSPTMHELCWLWADVYRPVEIRSYDSVDAVPLTSIPVRQRRFLEIVAKNLEIASHAWRFDSDHLDGLRAGGLQFTDATLDSVARCQRRYVAQSATIQQHLGRTEQRARSRPAFLEFA